MKEVHASVREVAVLQAATEMILSSMDADTVLHQILLIVRNYFGVSTCAVMLVDRVTNELFVRAQNGYEPSVSSRRYRIGQDGVTGHVAKTHSPMYVPDTRKESRYIRLNESSLSELALPLIVRDELIGVLDVESDKADHFTDEMIGILAVFAGQAAVALENARLYSSERRRMRQIEFVNLIARSTTTAGSVDQLLTTLCDLLYDAFDGPDVCILMRAPSGGYTITAHSGPGTPDSDALQISVESGLIAEAFRARMNVISRPRAAESSPRPCFAGALVELAVPLLSLGETLGIILISSKQAGYFTAEDRSVAQAAADVCASSLRNVQLAEELRRVTNTDSLTGLFNQRYFHIVVAQEISRAKRFNKQFTVLMFDLKDFRQINAQLGFEAGDQALRSVARLLSSFVRGVDTVCRYSGDKFALVLPEIDAQHAEAVRAKIAKALRSSVAAEERTLEMSAVFAQVNHPQDGGTELELVRKLLKALDGSKQRAQSANA